MPEGNDLIGYIKNDPTVLLLLIMLVVPLGALPRMIKYFSIYRYGEEFTFDGNTRTIQRNNEKIAIFNEVDRLQIKAIKSETRQGETSIYGLSVVLQGGTKVEIHTDDNREAIDSLADDLTNLLEVDIIRK